MAELADKLFNTVPELVGVRVTILGVVVTVKLEVWLPDRVTKAD
jgi:hypothetical protein